VSFAAITLCVASSTCAVVYFGIDSVRKLVDTPAYSSLKLVTTAAAAAAAATTKLWAVVATCHFIG
jgi:hypothetical protein